MHALLLASLQNVQFWQFHSMVGASCATAVDADVDDEAEPKPMPLPTVAGSRDDTVRQVITSYAKPDW